MKCFVVFIVLLLWLPGSTVFAFAPADSSRPEQVVNRLDILGDKYQLTTPTGRTITSSIKILRSQLLKQKAAFRKATLFITADESSSYKQRIDILDMMETTGIKRYKLVSADEIATGWWRDEEAREITMPRFSPSQEVAVTSPAYASSDTVLRTDPATLQIQIDNRQISVQLFGDKEQIKDSLSFVNYLRRNKKRIDAGKIYITGADDLVYTRFQMLIDVLKQFGYMRFRLVTPQTE